MGRARTVEDEEILEAARQVFLTRGQLATTREIAEAAGISQAVLYQRFGSKDELFFSAMAPPPPNTDELLGEPPAAVHQTESYLVGLAERLYHYFEAVAPLFVQLATHTAFDANHLANAHRPLVHSGLLESLGKRFDELAATGCVRTGDGNAMAQLLVALIHAEALSSVLLKTAPDADRRREMIGLIWRGLSPTDTSG